MKLIAGRKPGFLEKLRVPGDILVNIIRNDIIIILNLVYIFQKISLDKGIKSFG